MKKFNLSTCLVALATMSLCTSCSKTPQPRTYDPGPVPPTPSSIVYPVLYAGLSWDSSSAGPKVIRPPFPILFYIDSTWLGIRVQVKLKQENIPRSDSLPYVYYHKIAQDTTPLFYTIDTIYDDLGDKYGPLLIFGRQYANIDFDRKADVTINYIK